LSFVVQLGLIFVLPFAVITNNDCIFCENDLVTDKNVELIEMQDAEVAGIQHRGVFWHPLITTYTPVLDKDEV
jgi:hypothetical protein